MSTPAGAISALAGAAGLALGLAAATADVPGLAAGAGVLALTAGVLGWRSASARPAAVDPDELTKARAREQILGDRLAMLEAAQAAAIRLAAPSTEHDSAGLLVSAGSSPAEGNGLAQGSAKAGGEKLLNDPQTGLFTEAYFAVALEQRIAAARRRLRPVALVLLEAVNVDGSAAIDAGHVTAALKATLREADTACRLDDGRFALLLEDTPENGAIWTVERVRTHLNEQDRNVTVWAGVACYPAHAFDTVEILEQVHVALAHAKEWAQGAIEVAHAD